MSDEHGISRRTFIARGAAAGGAVVLAGAAGTALSACSSSPSTSSSTTAAAGGKPGVGTGTPVPGGALSVGLLSEIDGFYPPQNHWDTSGYIYAQCLYDPLMAIAADGTIQPYLAESCTPNSTFDTWTLTLRPNVKFNDGSALTSDRGRQQLRHPQGLAADRPGPHPGRVVHGHRTPDRRVRTPGAQSRVRRRTRHPGRLRRSARP